MNDTNLEPLKALEAELNEAAQRGGQRSTLRLDSSRPMPAPPPAEELDQERQFKLERELDRLHSAAISEQSTANQTTNWLVGSQALFVHAYLMLLVILHTGMLPLNSWLMLGVAVIASGCAVAMGGSLRRTRGVLGMLVLQRRAVEIELASAAGRTPNLPRGTEAGAGLWLTPAFVAVWIGLFFYTVALQFL
jgi:hypothetical protein